jgi:hypothetical protein
MIKNIMLTAALLAGVVLLDWKDFRKTTLITKWITFTVLGLSGIIWIYIVTAVNVPRPAVWLEHMLEPFDPIKQ